MAPTALAEPGVDALAAAPGLISPQDGAHTTGSVTAHPRRVLYPPLGIPTFVWQDVASSKYELEVATTSVFGASVILRRSNLQYPTYTPTGFDEIGSGLGLTEDALRNFIDEAAFYWHVRAWDDTLRQWGNFSPVASFTRHWGYAPS